MRKTSTPIVRKIRVFDAVIIAKLVYGLDTVSVLESQERQIDAVFYKGLRKILHKAPTFIDRQNTNQLLLKLANEYKQPNANPIIPPSERIQRMRLKMLGHNIRCPTDDPLRQAVIDHENKPMIPLIRRAGIPRKNWANEVMIAAYDRYAVKNGIQTHDPKVVNITNNERTKITSIANRRRKWRQDVVCFPATAGPA